VEATDSKKTKCRQALNGPLQNSPTTIRTEGQARRIKEKTGAECGSDGDDERPEEARSRGARTPRSGKTSTRSIGRCRTLESVLRIATFKVCIGSGVHG